MYSRDVADQTLTFGVSGKLTRNTLIMFDRETDSLWPQITGEAIDGEFVGNTLEFLPAIHTTWGEWVAEFPDTVALVKGYSGNIDNYNDYYTSGRAGVIPEDRVDNRLYTKEYVIGVDLGDAQIAYPYSELNRQPLINDTVAGREVLVVFSLESGAGVIFDRQFDGQTLTFTQNGDGDLVDDQTGTTWDSLSGEAKAGDLDGSRLTQIKSSRIFWFGWKDWYPDTIIYGLQ